MSAGSVVTGTVKDGSTAAGSQGRTPGPLTHLRHRDHELEGAYRLVLPNGDYFVYASGPSKAY